MFLSVYLDNAATSFQKPDEVLEAVKDYMRHVGVSAGRGTYRKAQQAEEILNAARTALAELLGVDDASRIIFTSCATESINLALVGVLQRGDHVITSAMEHNAVWRTLKALERARVISISTVPHQEDGSMLVDRIPKLLRKNTRLFVTTHASNVSGTIMPISPLSRIAKRHGALLLVDAAQTAGSVVVDVKKMGIDMLAFTGHKGLMGPQGTGGLYIDRDIYLRPHRYGGSGLESALDHQPDSLPHRHEAGTVNGPGIAGLRDAVEFITGKGVENINQKETELLAYALDKFPRHEALHVYGPADPERRVGIVTFNIEGIRPEETAYFLDEMFEVMVRAGLHCSPQAHRVIGTYPEGAVRMSIGYFNTQQDIDALMDGIYMLLEQI